MALKPKRKKSQRMAMRNALDKELSLLIKLRADWKCELCRRDCGPTAQYQAHWSHHIGRARHAVRWHPLNSCCHCASCHRMLEGDPLKHADFIRGWMADHYGDNGEICDYLRLLASQPAAFRDTELRGMLDHYRAERKRLMDARGSGQAGRIEFDVWEGEMAPSDER